MEPVLELVGVGVRRDGHWILDGIDWTVEAGERWAIVGPNGSGKTTLLNSISGFYPVESGHIDLGGVDATHSTIAARAVAGVGRTFQTPRLVDDLSVLDNVALGSFAKHEANNIGVILRLPKSRRDEKRSRSEARSLLELVGLDDRADELAEELTHGQKRMVEIGRALAGGPSVLLLDEPAAGLSLFEVDRLGDLMRQLRKHGLTVVIVEHHIELVRGTADDVTVLDEGHVIASGSPAEVFDDPAVRSRYLGIVGA